MATTFAGTLAKGNVQYYFEIAEDAYIEKTFIVGGNMDDEHWGHFTIEEARKCYRALLRKGFKVHKDDICQAGHGADMNQAFINQEIRKASK